MTNLKIGLSVVAAAVAVGVPASMYSGDASEPIEPMTAFGETTTQDDLARQRTRGSLDAPLTMYEFADFQCPACRILFEGTMRGLKEDYIDAGKLKLIFLNFPIAQLHANAQASHEVAMCAARQDAFWPVHDLLFSNQEEWAGLQDPAPYFTILARTAGLNVDTLDACLASGVTRPLIQAEFNAAMRAGIQSTPSLVLEGNLLVGAVPLDVLRPILDSIYEVRMSEQ